MGLFYNPHNWGDDFDLAISQSESPLFTFDADVVAPKIVAYRGTRKIKTYDEADGLVVSIDRRSVTWSLNGADFINYIGQKVSFEMSFFESGAVEYTLGLNIKESKL